MSAFRITLSGKGLSMSRVMKMAEALAPAGTGREVSVCKVPKPPTSRADRFAEAQSKAEEAKNEMESLKDELQDWYDNLPESFQSSDKGQRLEAAISELENAVVGLEEATNASPEFPSMYG